MTSAQQRCDAKEYPPTHTYDIATLTPTGVLADRISRIESACPELFSGSSFLDVGSSKGYFSLRAARSFGRVVSVEPDQEAIECWKTVSPENVAILNDTFMESDLQGTFDRVFVGNVAHYIYRESGGWSWVEKLARVSSDIVVMEGPLGMDCSDMADCIPPMLQLGFSRDGWRSAMYPHFDLLCSSRTTSYTPDRWITVWKRIDDLIRCSMERYSDYLEIVYKSISQWCLSEDVVQEVCCRHDRGVISKKIIPHSKFVTVDKDPSRAEVKCDLMREELPDADITLSTAILHHVDKSDWKHVLGNMTRHTRRLIALSGPDEDVLPDLIGDHKSHLREPDVTAVMNSLGWSLVGHRGIGLNQPWSEMLLIYRGDR